MLISERKTQVYQRTDGGDGKGPSGKLQEGEGATKQNQPLDDTPKRAWNMAIPVFFLVFFIFYLLVKTGEDGTDQDFLTKIENSDSFSALLWGTMAATGVSFLLYHLQFVQEGNLVMPTWPVVKSVFLKSTAETTKQKDSSAQFTTPDDITDTVSSGSAEESTILASTKARPLLSVSEGVEAFLYGMGRIFPALIVLTLAWASGAIMTAVGADRLFSRWITNGISPEAMPTVSFLIAIFMALSTGTSWGTMTILFPLLCVPTYKIANGDPTIFYSTVAGILSGSVAGDHISPISDTTVLSALASDCQLLNHVATQAPYAVIVMLLSVFFGTLPIGMAKSMPNIVSILLGVVAIAIVVYGLCVPVLSPTGRFDIFTQLWLRFKKDSALRQLQEDTVKRYNSNNDSLAVAATVGEVENDDEESAGSVNINDDLPRPALSEVSA